MSASFPAVPVKVPSDSLPSSSIFLIEVLLSEILDQDGYADDPDKILMAWLVVPEYWEILWVVSTLDLYFLFGLSLPL